MSILLDGTGGVTTPAETVQGALTTTGNTILGDATTDTLNVGAGGLVKDASGNVGIGTATPARILDIAAPNAGPGFGLRVKASTGTNGALMQASNTGGNLYFAIDTSTGASFGVAYAANIYYDGNYPMQFAVGNQVQATITTTGLLQFNSGYGSVATAYGCRAWVNFNGTGTVAIRASGNVSSITDNGVGTYTVNFTTAMPDANYASLKNVQESGVVQVVRGDNISASQAGVYVVNTSNVISDATYVFFAAFR
jgi:hypothetical protein